MFILILQWKIFCLIRGRSVVASVPLRALESLAPLMILRLRNLIFLRYSRLRGNNLSSLGFCLLNNVPSLRHIMEAFFEAKQLFLYSCEFFYRTMLYMLFTNSFTPYTSSLARSSWKPCKASGCKIGGGTKVSIGGIWIDPTTLGA